MSWYTESLSNSVVKWNNDTSSASDRHFNIVIDRLLQHNNGSKFEPFTADSEVHSVVQSSVVDTNSVDNAGWHVNHSHAETGIGSEVDSRESSVSIEEANFVRVDNRFVLGNNHLVFNEVVKLSQSSVEGDFMDSVSDEISRKLDIDNLDVNESGSSKVGDVGVTQAVSVTEARQLSEGRSAREDRQQLSKDGTFIIKSVVEWRVKESPFIAADHFDEAGDIVVIIVAGSVVSTLSQVEDALVESKLASKSFDYVIDRAIVREVCKRVRIVGDIVSKFHFTVDFLRGNVALEMEVVVLKISMSSGKNHSSNVSQKHSSFKVFNLGDEESSDNRVNVNRYVMSALVVFSLDSFRCTISVELSRGLDITVKHLVLIVESI